MMHTLIGQDGLGYWCDCSIGRDHDDQDRTCVCTNAQGELVRRLVSTCTHTCMRDDPDKSLRS